MGNQWTTTRRTVRWAIVWTLLAVPIATAHEGAHEHADKSTGDQPANEVTIAVEGNYRIITANGVPDHVAGHRNPGKVAAQEYRFRVPLKPKPADRPTPLRHAPFGVAVNGVVFDPSTNEFWNLDRRWMYEALSGKIELGLDANRAHVQPGGKYHYHGLPTALLARIGANKEMALVGYAADGFPIYGPLAHVKAEDPASPLRAMKPSYRIKRGQRPGGEDGPGGRYDGTYFADWEYVAGLGDLDDFNGRTGVTPDYPDGTYYYVLTDAFPFVPRQWRGEPDPSFLRRPDGNGGGNGGGGNGGGNGGGRPPEDGRGGPRDDRRDRRPGGPGERPPHWH
jgi:hypothetical protein